MSDVNGEGISISRYRQQPIMMGFFALLALLILYATGRVIAPYVIPIIFAAIIVTFTFPLFVRLRERLKGRQNLAAILMLLGVVLILVIPAFILGVLLVQQATDLFDVFQKTDVPKLVQSLRINERLSFLSRLIPGFNPASVKPDVMLVGLVRQIPAFVATRGGAVLAGIVNIVIGFFLMLLAAFYFYIEGERLIQELVELSPLPDKYDRELFAKIKSVIDATFRGQVLTAIAQGIVTGVGLAIAGVPAAMFWGAVAAVFSLLPMVGAATVWIPAAAYLFFVAANGGGPYWKAVFLVLWGILAVSLVDNVIRPWAMKEGTEMPAVILFFSILGGIQAFGFVGMLLGPLVFVLLISILDIYKELFRKGGREYVETTDEDTDRIPSES